MRRWLRDNPWIWIVLLFAALVIASLMTIFIAELNKPEIVRESRDASTDSSLPPESSGKRTRST